LATTSRDVRAECYVLVLVEGPEARVGTHLWAESYERDLRDVLDWHAR